MSDTEYVIGKLKKMDLKGIELEEYCENECNKNGYVLERWNKSYTSLFISEKYSEYTVFNNNLYQVVEKENKDSYDDVFNAHEVDSETISFELKYYNGGCSFEEAIQTALEKIAEGGGFGTAKLNEDQQIVLDWLKCDAFSRKTLNPIGSIWKLNNCDVTENVAQAFVGLTDSKQFEVLQAFAEWGLSNDK